MATGERAGNEMPAALSEYVAALPLVEGAERARRDAGERRMRLVPHLRAHAVREHGRVRRRRAVTRAALLFTTVGGAAALALVFTGGLRPGVTRLGAQIAVLDGTLWL